MSLIVRGLVAIAAATTLSFPTTPPDSVEVQRSAGRGRPVTRPAVPEKPTVEFYSTNQLEHYLTDEGIAFIRPGLHMTVNSVVIGSDRRPEVDVTFKDDFGRPVDRLGMTTPGAVSATLIMAWYNPEIRELVNYNVRNVGGVTQADRDRTGTWTDLETGHSVYKFGTVLPIDYDRSKTHTLGIYAERDLEEWIEKVYVDNVLFDFRPDGGTIVNKWDKINDTTSCLNCHDPLALHGGARRDVKLCVLCHNSQSIDPESGNSVDAKVMIHKIHMGANLPSVQAGTPYEIIGYRNSVHDYSEVVLPQDIRNCANCHSGTNPSQAPSQQDAWYSYPSSAACGSCHDDVNFVTGENHAAGPRDDSTCSTCHIPDSGTELDASIVGAHTIPTKSKQLTGVNVEVVSVSNMEPGMSPTVVLRVEQNDGTPIGPETFTRSFHPILAGPTTDYEHYYREDGRTRAVFDSATGNTTFTFTNMIPVDADGTWVISGDFRRDSIIKDGQGNDVTVTEAGVNPIAYFALDGGTAKARRTVVDQNSCHECHEQLAFHGGQRLLVEECVICHNPFESDAEVRPASEGLPESISFARLIHKIHAGSELTQDFTVYGYRSSVHNYNHVEYVGDLRNCEKCHTGGSHIVPPPPGAQPVMTLRDYFSPQGPGTAACLGCHDFQDAAAHAYLNTTQFPGSDNPSESCGVCHGEGADWATDKVHAR